MANSKRPGFVFGRDERRALAGLLANIKGKRMQPKKIEYFLDGATHAISLWAKCWPEIRVEGRKADRGYLEKLAGDIMQAVRGLRLMPDGIYPVFWRQVAEHARFPPGLGGGTGQNDWNETYGLVVRWLSDLGGLAGELASDASFCKGLETRRKRDLVKGLAMSYESAFDQAPASSRNGTFMAILGAIGDMLAKRGYEITIGEAVVRESLKEHRAFYDSARSIDIT